jgi:hypothetical protein
MAITAVGRAQGTSTERRLKDLALKGRLIKRANERPRRNSKGTEKEVKMRVFFKVFLRS